ncbi:DMT family transporter [Carboxylicivirga mesophila]|uniref:DMT family transporter n=1 Tax=Carboxylicivirga mesophila TaxID=1166478 RepID=A0ABS5KAM2_9BACT|nr:DMT family transporter [Carboxylicivirga mesophila]MBS2212014.1 DMT family transporter [Carboxylicivirga mesophila]
MPWEKKWFQFTVLLLLAFIWGSSFILMKIGLKSFDNIQVASLRMGFASLFLLPLALPHLKTLKRKDILPLLVAGFVGNLIPAFLFTKAQTRIDSSLAGMLNSLTPVFTLVVSVVFFKLKSRLSQYLGITLGLIGALGLIVSGQSVSLNNLNTYAFFVVAATICYAVNINVVKAYLTHLSGVQITALSFLFFGPVALYYFFSSDIQAATQNPDWLLHLGALALLGFIGTATAMLLMNTLIKYSSPVFASSVTYVIPIFAIMWGMLDGETVTAYHFLFMGIVLLGVYLTKKGSR